MSKHRAIILLSGLFGLLAVVAVSEATLAGDTSGGFLVPNLKCYKIDNRRLPTPESIALRDQFDLMVVTVGQPVLFCERALKERLTRTGSGKVQTQLTGVQASGSPSLDRMNFHIQGTGIESARLQVFDLSGRTLYDSNFVNGQTLSWNLLNNRSLPVANGIYLYVVYVRGFDGAIINTQVRKLVVIR